MWGENNHRAKQLIINKIHHKLHMYIIKTKIAVCPLLTHKAVTFTYDEPQILIEEID